MSEIKALDKLRGLRDEAASKSVDNPRWVCARAEEIADEIEAEIADNYTRLPVDRNGEPWHIGDKFAFAGADGRKHICTVSGVSDCEVFFYYDEHSNSTKHRHFTACAIAHVKPRTLEDIVQDAIQYGYSHGKAGMDVSEQRDKYADEIRELLLGGDAE